MKILDRAFCIFPITLSRVNQPSTLIRPSKDHKLKPLGLANFFRKFSGGYRENLKKKPRSGVKLTSPLVFPGLNEIVHVYISNSSSSSSSSSSIEHL